MSDFIDLVTGYWTLRKLKNQGYIKESDFNLSFGQFIIRSVKAIKNIDKEEKDYEIK